MTSLHRRDTENNRLTLRQRDKVLLTGSSAPAAGSHREETGRNCISRAPWITHGAGRSGTPSDTAGLVLRGGEYACSAENDPDRIVRRCWENMPLYSGTDTRSMAPSI